MKDPRWFTIGEKIIHSLMWITIAALIIATVKVVFNL